MAVLLNNSPSATQATTATTPSRLSPGEQYCSPYEEQMLHKVMAAFYSSINDPKKMRMLESWMLQSHNIGVTVGQIAFKLLFTIYTSAQHAGIKLPDTVFMAQGGAVYQVIDRLLAIAEQAGVKVNPDQAREDALGIVVDNIRKNEGAIKGQGGNAQQGAPQGQGLPQGPVMAANPMAHAVGQGLQQQGLMGGAQ